MIIWFEYIYKQIIKAILLAWL